jgi:hypothetical protein
VHFEKDINLQGHFQLPISDDHNLGWICEEISSPNTQIDVLVYPTHISKDIPYSCTANIFHFLKKGSK